MDYEQIATSAVINAVSKTSRLKAFVNSGDKEPSFDGNIYIYDNNNLNPQYFTRDEALKYISQMNQQQQNNESVERLNELKPKNYDSLPNKIRLYHGTDIYALEDILIDGEINAKAGRRTGETICRVSVGTGSTEHAVLRIDRSCL